MDIERAILDQTEEDFYGLWEIGWRLRAVLGLDPTHEPDEAADAVESLRRLVEIYVREWADDAPLPIGSTGRTIDLHAPESWLVPDHGQPQFLVGSSPDGSWRR